ncbi:MAG: hypothetical protein NZ959_03570 [Armatimonadetes bacterium]|nr:hypothetical protein [Armatimonadota bacterium]MDW8121721.1 hypothetical protein [Armatimonadota bacterium]
MTKGFFWTCSFIALGFSWILYVFAVFICPPQMVYFWLIYNPDDQNVHLMWARQAYEGSFFFRDLYTTDPHPGLFFNLFAYSLGLFSRWTGISLHLSYQLFRTIAALAFLFTLSWFSALFLTSEQSRRTFFALSLFSSGFGWIPIVRDVLTGRQGSFYFTDVSPHLTTPEAFSLLSMTVAPLALIGITLSLGFLGLSFASLSPANPLPFVAGAAACGALLAHLHPYAAPPALLALLLFHLTVTLNSKGRERRNWLFFLLTVAPAVAVLVLQAFIFSQDPAFARKAATETLTPSPLIVAGTFGIPGVIALLSLPTLISSIRAGDLRTAVPFFWAVGILVCIYLPVSFQRKMMEGFQIPLCFLATKGLERWSNRIPSLTRPIGLMLIILLSAPSHLAFLGLNGYWLVHNNLIPERRMMPPYFLHRDQLTLLKRLEQEPDRGAVLCNPMIGNYVPVLTGKPVFVGHWAETLDFVPKLREATRILRGEFPVDEAMAFFRRHHIAFALDTFWERLLCGGPTALERYGEIVFQVGEEKLYRIGSKEPER